MEGEYQWQFEIANIRPNINAVSNGLYILFVDHGPGGGSAYLGVFYYYDVDESVVDNGSEASDYLSGEQKAGMQYLTTQIGRHIYNQNKLQYA